MPNNSVKKATTETTRRMRPLRFGIGLLLTTSGMGLILLIGIRVLDVRQIGGDFALILVAIGVLCGVTLLGGGFGLMVTASSGFDEQEFDRLMTAGNIASAGIDEKRPDTSSETAMEHVA